MKPNEGDIWAYGYLDGHKEHYLFIEFVHASFSEERWRALRLETGLVEDVWWSAPAYQKVA